MTRNKFSANVQAVRGRVQDYTDINLRVKDATAYNGAHRNNRLGFFEVTVNTMSQIRRFCHYVYGVGGGGTQPTQPSQDNVMIGLAGQNKIFRPGQSWRTPSGYVFAFQNEHNLVLYSPQGTPLWATDCHRLKPDMLAFQGDGNVVLYASGRAIWATNTNGRAQGGAFGILNDGNLAVIDRNGRALWQSGTARGTRRDRQAART
ncbi:MAG: hypothetical protein AAF744_03385 [Pseudomonadota bacterium]